MGTEVLRPQDCLTERLRLGPAVLPRSKPFAGNPSPCRKPVTRPEPRKRYPNPEPAYSRKSGASSDDSKSPKNLVMGQVTILKRGESLDSKRKNESLKRNVSAPSADLIDCCVEWLGPDPEMVPKQLRIAAGRCDVYAGSAFYQSPSPSSLPLPTFSRKKDGLLPMTVDDSATKDLRRLLRLN